VTEELPFPIAQQKRREGFEPPLDEIDGAAYVAHLTIFISSICHSMLIMLTLLLCGCIYRCSRILDPIWRSIREGIHDFGMFFKDYRPADW
jgi:hypothetical protein